MSSKAALIALAIVVACGSPPAALHLDGDPALPGIASPDASMTAKLGAGNNRLILETSPYLRMHAKNPINWFAWGDEAFARAKRDRRLVLLSIGYSTCHWCHVMAEDSFENEEVAREVNANFIAIKVDREERPDVDAPYMDAVVAMTGSGGWPLTLVVDEERRPVFGATFLRHDKLLAVLRELRDQRANDPGKLALTSAQVMAHLARERAAPPPGVMGPEAVERGVRGTAATFDAEFGGFGRNTKFPRAPDLNLLLRYFRRTDDPQALAIVTKTAGEMATGGIRDQLGGGFHRYATDRQWRVPHFEKMLYDNAQLATLYLALSQIAREAAYADIARDTLDYLAREMLTADGGFASASDADSKGPDGRSVEGYFFTWTPAEIDAAAGDNASAVKAWFGVGTAGDPLVDGRSVLYLPQSADDPAIRAQLAAAHGPLLAARAKRSPPNRDDKVLASWNGLAIGAFARAGFALDRADYIAVAKRAATLVLDKLRGPDGALARSYTAGRAGGVATLTDYASFVAGLLDLFAATSEPVWLAAAIGLADRMERFADRERGGYFMTEGDPILVRQKPVEDGAEPSANAVAAMDFVRLGELTGDAKWTDRATKLFGAFGAELSRPGGYGALRAALEAFLDEPMTIVIVGDPIAGKPLVAEVRRVWLPTAAIIVAPTGAEQAAIAKLVPSVGGKRPQGGAPTAYVCIREVCRAPTTDPAVLARQLAIPTPLFPDHSPGPL